jgi:hypothetical protein
MSAACNSAFSRQLTLGDRPRRGVLANNALNTLIVLTAATVGLGFFSRARSSRPTPEHLPQSRASWR